MREILFKAVSTDGKWVEGLFCKCKQIWSQLFTPCIQIIKEWDSGDYLDHIEVLPETVCQFTGLVDKNGVKIFEGDNVDAEYYSGAVCYGYYELLSNVVIRHCVCAGNGALTTKNKTTNIVNCTVIGNIHDSKLKG